MPDKRKAGQRAILSYFEPQDGSLFVVRPRKGLSPAAEGVGDALRAEIEAAGIDAHVISDLSLTRDLRVEHIACTEPGLITVRAHPAHADEANAAAERLAAHLQEQGLVIPIVVLPHDVSVSHIQAAQLQRLGLQRTMRSTPPNALTDEAHHQEEPLR